MNNWLRRTINARISLLKKWRKAYEEQNRLFPRDYDSKAIQKLTKQIEELQAVTDWLKTAGKDTNVPTKNEPCGDCISRASVFAQINCWIGSGEYRRTNAARYLWERIKGLRSVKPQEPKTGQWAVVSNGYGDGAYICECSECKDTVWVYKDAERRWNYCPNCGAKMEDNNE